MATPIGYKVAKVMDKWMQLSSFSSVALQEMKDSLHR